ncbi:hypothetical protein G9A89_001460 [Geosiphon pyriformis]|nr:hypothetical protein G9A89_001460 [Geosiphon pyriformis]
MDTNENNTLSEKEFEQEKISVIVLDDASSVDNESRSSQASSTRRLIGNIDVKKRIYETFIGIFSPINLFFLNFSSSISSFFALIKKNYITAFAYWLIFGIPILIISQQCNNLNPSDGPVTHFSYDPSIFKDLDINAFGHNYISRNVFIYQNNATTPNITVDFKSITLQKKALKHTLYQGEYVHGLDFYLPSVSSFWNLFSLNTLMGRCASINVDIHLPIKLKDPQNTITNLEILNFNVNIMKNPVIYNHSALNIKAINGNINVYDLSARSASLTIKRGGNMTGVIAEIQDELYASNNEGNYINLVIKNITGKGSPKIEAKTESGRLSLIFENHTFSGTYNLSTKKGDILIKYPDAIDFQKKGIKEKFGTLDIVGMENLDSKLIANSTSGNIRIGF